MSWPLASTVSAWGRPQSVPVGRFTLPCCTAAETSSTPISREARREGSSCTRTAYFWEPNTWTWATPLTMETRWAIRVSAYSSTWERGRVGELRAR